MPKLPTLRMAKLTEEIERTLEEAAMVIRLLASSSTYFPLLLYCGGLSKSKFRKEMVNNVLFESSFTVMESLLKLI